MPNGEMVDKQSDLGACAFDLPNGQNPGNRAPMYYGNQRVPHPCNSAAEVVNHSKVMTQVMEGK